MSRQAKFTTLFQVLCGFFILGTATLSQAQPLDQGMLKVGDFRCVNLAPLLNDAAYTVNEWGAYCGSGVRHQVMKRHGIPFWALGGGIRVAGHDWKPAAALVMSSSKLGAKAQTDSPKAGSGTLEAANDGDVGTYWYAGEKDGKAAGRLWIEFASPAKVDSIHLLSWSSPRHAPKDYVVGLILVDGSRQEVATVHRRLGVEENGTVPAPNGQWNSWPAGGREAKGIYLDVASTLDNVYGPVVYEFQARGSFVKPPAVAQIPWSTERKIDLRGATAKWIHCLGQVVDGIPFNADTRTTVGEYVLRYANGQEEIYPLVAGLNVAPERYGNFVPEAPLAFCFVDRTAAEIDPPGTRYYHLDEQLPVAPCRQVMRAEFRVAHPEWPLASLTFRCTRSEVSLILAGVTLQQGDKRINALNYGNGVIKPYPADLPKKVSMAHLEHEQGLADLSLDGVWLYRPDPGNRGIREQYFKPLRNKTDWARMKVPSNWYAEELDVHGVVWFRKSFKIPADWPGRTLHLRFGAVDYDARVWVNGQYAGRHIGAFASFELDITKLARRGADNEIVVRVDSPFDPGFYHNKTVAKGNSMADICTPYDQEGCMGGLTRPVALMARGGVILRDAWTSCSLSPDLSHATVTVNVDVTTDTISPDSPIKLRCRITEPKNNKSARHFEQTREITPSANRTVQFVFEIDHPLVWMPWEQGTPWLHRLEFEALRAGESLDRLQSRFGVRQVRFDRDKACVWVNHHRVFLKGALYDDPHWMALMTPDGYKQRLELMKRANMNVIRMIGHQSNPALYELADAMGMMIWQEMPLQGGYASNEPVQRDIWSVCRETMLQCRSHASVIGWSGWNEGGQGEFSERLLEMLRALDLTGRPFSKGSGYGDFDIHTYPNIFSWLCHRTALWTGTQAKFISEMGAYGLSSPDELNGLIGKNWFPQDTAEFIWETFNEYRYMCGPVFREGPVLAPDATNAQVLDYVRKLQPASERWLYQYMKFAFENFRGGQFDPCCALMHCRFDDAVPSAYLGLVNYNGTPRKALGGMGQACQAVVPILFFDFQSAKDVRVVNSYWFKSWKGCTLQYEIADGNGKVLKQGKRNFDLPAETVVPVVKREEIGDIWGLPGLKAKFAVLDAKGKVLSKNDYDLTREELRAFVTSVYPQPGEIPYGGVLLKVEEAITSAGLKTRPAQGESYGRLIAEPVGPAAYSIKFQVNVHRPGLYAIRPACNSNVALREARCLVDGAPAVLENYPGVSMTSSMSRRNWGAGRNGLVSRLDHLAETRHAHDRTNGTNQTPGRLANGSALRTMVERVVGP